MGPGWQREGGDAGAGGAGEACVADRGRWLVGSSAKVGGGTRGLRVAERAGAKQAAVEWGRDGAGRG